MDVVEQIISERKLHMGINTAGLKVQRLKKGLTLTGLATEAMVPVDAVQRWENGNMKPEDNFGDLFRICDVLGIKFPRAGKTLEVA